MAFPRTQSGNRFGGLLAVLFYAVIATAGFGVALSEGFLIWIAHDFGHPITADAVALTISGVIVMFGALGIIFWFCKWTQDLPSESQDQLEPVQHVAELAAPDWAPLPRLSRQQPY